MHAFRLAFKMHLKGWGFVYGVFAVFSLKNKRK
jgi:hypothetical protein